MALNETDKQKLAKLYDVMKKEKYHNIGYPENADFDYKDIFKFMEFSVNNVGDPFGSSTYLLNSLEFEKEVVEFFLNLFRIEKNNGWGYVTTGGTEGNLFGVFAGRELLENPVLYYSEEAHYSIDKISRILKIPSKVIKTLPNGEMDYADLKSELNKNAGRPPLIFATIGTTMKGAVDNVYEIKKIFEELKISNFYIHGDAALSGMILPFVSSYEDNIFDHLDSIAISGHKFIGSPIPSGVVITKKENIEKISRVIDYIDAADNTIVGSRNGINPLILWHAIKEERREGLDKRAKDCIDKAIEAEKRFRKNGIPAWRNPNSITVVFPKPSRKIWSKWCLANSGEWAHIVTTKHVSLEKIDELIKDLVLEKSNK